MEVKTLRNQWRWSFGLLVAFVVVRPLSTGFSLGSSNHLQLLTYNYSGLQDGAATIGTTTVAATSAASLTATADDSAASLWRIVLGAETQLARHVPPGANVLLTCRFHNPIWYFNGQRRAPPNETPAAGWKLSGLSAEQAGVYSCYTGSASLLHGLKWSNLTLHVDSESSAQQATRTTAKMQTNENERKSDAADYATPATTATNTNVSSDQPASAPKFRGNDMLIASLEKPRGGSLMLICQAVGSPTPTITWLHNNAPLRRAASYHKWSLHIDAVDTADAGNYTCRICNYLGCIAHSTSVAVVEWPRLSAPQIGIWPKNHTVLVGEAAEFECRTDTAQQSHVVWLRYEQQNLTLAQLQQAQTVRLNASNEDKPQLLRLANVTRANEGWYSCDVATGQGDMRASTYLHVKEESIASLVGYDKTAAKSAKALSRAHSASPLVDESYTDNADGDSDVVDGQEASPPRFKKTDKLVHSIHRPAGNSIQLNCAVVGNPEPKLHWTLNGQQISRQFGKATYKRWSMSMDDLITEDSGNYTCHACNPSGCISHSTLLTIKERIRARPYLSDKFPQNRTVLTNSTTELECRVMSDLEPHIRWIRFRQPNLTLNKLDQYVPKVGEGGAKNGTVTMYTDPDDPLKLRLENVTHDDEGWYTCIAANALGQSWASAYVRVVDELPSSTLYMLLRSHPIWNTLVPIVVIVFVLGTVFIVYVLRRLKQERLMKHRIETVHQWTKKVIIYKPAGSDGSTCDLQMPVIKIEKQRTTFETSGNVDPTQPFNEYEFPLDSNWEIPRSQLALGSTLGEGAFGRVVMAEAIGMQRQGGGGGAGGGGGYNTGTATTIVAVKMVKEEHTDADMASLVREMEVMKMIGKHINIINLLGCCTQNGPLWVIVEFAPHGNLKDFLKRHRPLFVASPSLQRDSSCLEDSSTGIAGACAAAAPSTEPLALTEKKLVSFAFQIARGMEYLASRRKLPAKILIKQKHLVDSFETTRPSLSPADVAKYQKTYARFTNKEKTSPRDFVSKRATLA